MYFAAIIIYTPYGMKIKRIIKHLLFWISIFLVFTLVPGIYQGSIKDAFILNLIYLPLDIAATYILIYLVLEPFVKRGQAVLFILSIVGVYSITIGLSVAINYFLQPLLNLEINQDPVLQQVFNSFLILTTIFGMAFTLKLFNIYGDIKIKKVELEYKNIKSELNLLKSQINPHFLFNTLNNIDELIYEDRDKSSIAIHKLSAIMRYMLRDTNTEKQLLENEIRFISDYTELAGTGFTDNNFISFSIKGNPEGRRIAPMLFIAIVENTIKHCNSNVKAPGIWIDFEVEDNFVALKTKNYLAKSKVQNDKSGLGLINLRKRLDLQYPGKYQLQTTKENDTFCAMLKIYLS